MFTDERVFSHPEIRRLGPKDLAKFILGDHTGCRQNNEGHEDLWMTIRRDLQAAMPRRLLGLLRAALSRNLLMSVPLSLCTNQYAFAYGPEGWHYWRDLAMQIISEPDIQMGKMRFYKFFQRCHSRSYTQLMTFHKQREMTGLPEVPFGSFPWGAFDRFAVIDPNRFVDTSEDRKSQNFMWFEIGPSIDSVLSKEFSLTVELLQSIRKTGYRPHFSNLNFPTGTFLVDNDGDVRFVQVSGAHRLAVLSALGHDRVVVRLDKDRYPPVFKENVDRWTYVQSGLISRTAALDFFDLYFAQNGIERASALGCIG